LVVGDLTGLAHQAEDKVGQFVLLVTRGSGSEGAALVLVQVHGGLLSPSPVRDTLADAPPVT
jgi:hypothetical protein